MYVHTFIQNLIPNFKWVDITAVIGRYGRLILKSENKKKSIVVFFTKSADVSLKVISDMPLRRTCEPLHLGQTQPPHNPIIST